MQAKSVGSATRRGGQSRHLRLKSVDSLPQLANFRFKLLSASSFGPIQLPQLGYLVAEIVDARRAGRDRVGRGTDEDSFTGLAEQQAVGSKLSHRRADDCARHAVSPGHLRGGRYRGPDRQLPVSDLLPQVVGDLAVRRLPDEIRHLTILHTFTQHRCASAQATPTPLNRLVNHMHYVKHSVLTWRKAAADSDAHPRTRAHDFNPRFT